jgi:hypothetical protein
VTPLMASARPKKRRTSAARRGASLPVIEVDVDDEEAMNEVANQIVAAILGAATASGSRKRAKKAKSKKTKKTKKTAKKRANSKR